LVVVALVEWLIVVYQEVEILQYSLQLHQLVVVVVVNTQKPHQLGVIMDYLADLAVVEQIILLLPAPEVLEILHQYLHPKEIMEEPFRVQGVQGVNGQLQVVVVLVEWGQVIHL
jgi:hypothetical protein